MNLYNNCIPAALLMVRPCRFGFNPQTAVNNAFQQNSLPEEETQRYALKEFDAYTSLLRAHNIPLLIVQDSPEPYTPDSIFPNNWISFHRWNRDGRTCSGAVLYPMFAPNRRLERKESVLEAIALNYPREAWIDLSYNEEENRFLEGTGSIIFDHLNRRAYVCRSPRSNEEVLNTLCDMLQYRPFMFNASDSQGSAIYHTNVMMCVADAYAVVCLASIPLESERLALKLQLEEDGKTIIPISLEQVNHFAGNMLQVFGKEVNGEIKKYLVMSAQAKKSLNAEQLEAIEKFNPILSPELETIETHGGGGARCMLAEIWGE